MAVSNDLLTDRRVHRHKHALEEAGYSVALIGRDDLCLRHRRGWLFYAELNWQLFRRLRCTETDMLWANDTDTLLGCWMASLPCLRSKPRRRPRLVLDAHELFPEVPEIQHKPLVRWVWRTLEQLLMPRCDGVLTVCQSIAAHYRQGLGLAVTVVRNMPDTVGTPHTDRNHSAKPAQKSQMAHLLYQGCVNLGRGVDWAIDALEHLPQCTLTVAGGGDLLEVMQAYARQKPWADRITFTGRLSPSELDALTQTADVGLVMLEDLGLSYHYALPNRIGDMVQAGVPMVVSDLPEMAAFVRKHQVGEVMHGPGPLELARSVGRVLSKTWCEADFDSARKDMDWNSEKTILLDWVQQTLFANQLLEKK